MSNEIIRFSCNWNNKLTNKAFTTLRLHNPNKYKPGQTYEIELNGKPQGRAVIKEIRTIYISQLNDFICFLDTGYNTTQMIGILNRMYANIDIRTQKFDFCLLVYLKETKQNNEPEQTTLPLT
jgi:hypothetical protein